MKSEDLEWVNISSEDLEMVNVGGDSFAQILFILLIIFLPAQLKKSLNIHETVTVLVNYEQSGMGNS